MEIQHLMKTEVFSVPIHATVADAARLVVTHRVGTLPVVDEDNKLVGIFGVHDLLRLTLPVFITMVEDWDFVQDFGAIEAEVIHPDPAILQKPITEIMSRAQHHVEYVHVDCGLVRAYALMRQERLYDLPVTDEAGRLVGIASRVDVAQAAFKVWLLSEEGNA